MAFSIRMRAVNSMKNPIDTQQQDKEQRGEGKRGLDRRHFLKLGGAGSLAWLGSRMPVMAGPFTPEDFEKLVPSDKKLGAAWIKSLFERGKPTVYQEADLKFIGMPVGGLCAGQLYLGGDGKLWHWDIFNKVIFTGYDAAHYPKPMVQESPLEQKFELTIAGKTRALDKTGFSNIRFRGEYPIGSVAYRAADVAVDLEAFSPFIPLQTDDSSLPATVMHFTLTNTSDKPIDATLTGSLENVIARSAICQRINRIVIGKNHACMECSAQKPERVAGPQKPDILFEDWNKDTYGGWTAEGNAFGKGPVKKSELPAHQSNVGGDTERVVNSHAAAPGADIAAKDDATGKLTSRPFKIERNFIALWIGGGNQAGKTCVNLRIAGKIADSATGANDNQMTLRYFNVQNLLGKTAAIEVVDDMGGSWANIGVGRIFFTDQAPQTENMEGLPDYGTMGLALLGGPPDVNNTEGRVGMLGRKIKLAPGASASVTFVLSWHLPNLSLPELPGGRYYATKFDSAKAVAQYIADHFERLASSTRLWRDTWYDSTLPYWFLDRTMSNTSVLATSTSFRFKNGRFYGWEGVGCCEGTCGHVWYYAQAMARLFPDLERDTRERVDFGLALQADGAIHFRGERNNIAAIDAQAGYILRAYREHQVSANDGFLKRNWPNTKKALEWMIRKDSNSDGLIEGPQHNTLDQDWHGEVAWLSGLYLAALRAGEEMALEMKDPGFAGTCRNLVKAGRKNIVEKLFNGEYFIHVGDPKFLNTVGSYDGCEIDQVLGQSWAYQVALGEVLPQKQTRIALKSLWKYNFTPDVGPYRKAYPAGRWYAMAGEAGTLMCSWPKGDAKRVTSGYDYYFNECMSGFEHQVASHMIWENMLVEGFAITRAIHDRYEASRRNPWNEAECGDHYARSMASYGSLIAACGFEYHGPRGHIGFAPRLTPENFKAPFTAAEGWGTYEQKSEVRGQKPEFRSQIMLKYGKLRIKTLALTAKAPATVRVTTNNKPLASRFAVKDGKILITLAEDAVIHAGQTLVVVAS
jgi:uncharacterized protein (DUF608 family)